jgi:hypothetical protein
VTLPRYAAPTVVAYQYAGASIERAVQLAESSTGEWTPYEPAAMAVRELREALLQALPVLRADTPPLSTSGTMRSLVAQVEAVLAKYAQPAQPTESSHG